MDANHHLPPLWSDLPLDIVRQIMIDLSLGDRLRLRLVCKNWLRIQLHEIHLSTIMRTSDQIPWILTSQSNEKNNITCKLHDPFYKKQKLKKQRNKYRTVPVPACASKKGWVLFSKINEHAGMYSFFLHNPFTNHFIKLPDLYYSSYNHHIELATFSTTPPTSPDCVFFVLIRAGFETAVKMCRLGDKSWSWKTEFVYNPLIVPFEDAVYFNGCFYCITKTGELRVYDVALENWSSLGTRSIRTISFRNVTHMVEWNEELFLITISESPSHVELFRFDKDNKDWVRYRDEGLEDTAIFIGKCSSYLVSGVGAIGEVANKVFYNVPYIDHTLSNLLIDFSVEGLEIDKWFCGKGKKKIWIQPPNL